MYTINFWPILVASVVAFGLSALWYSPILFGKEWMRLLKMTESDIAAAEARGIWKLYAIQFIATAVSFSVLGFILSTVEARGGSSGAFLGFIIWLGFIAAEVVGAMMWERKPFKLALIQSVGSLLNLVIGGAIIGAWR